MIRQHIHIPNIDWDVYVYYYVSCYYADEIIDKMESIDASPKFIKQAYRNMKSCNLDGGVTYSNYIHRTTVMVIGEATSKEEFFNTFIHESRHLIDDLSKMNGISHNGEEIAYLAGHIGEQMFPIIKLFVCDCSHCKRMLYEKTERD